MQKTNFGLMPLIFSCVMLCTLSNAMQPTSPRVPKRQREHEAASVQKLTYKEIGQQNLKAIDEDDIKIPVTPGGHVKKFIERQRGILLNLAHRVKTNIIFTLLTDHESNRNTAPPIINQDTWRDLNLLSGSEQNPTIYLGSLINRTSTSLGHSFLLGLVGRPILNYSTLTQRQEITKEFLQNPQLLNQTSSQLATMAEGEDQLLSFWNTRLQLPRTIRNQYWRFNEKIDELLNNSKLALDLKSTWATTQKCLGTTIQGTSAFLLTAYALSSLTSSLLGGNYYPDYVQAILEEYASRFTGTAGPMYAVLSASPWLRCGTAGAAGIFNALGLESAIAWTKADLSIDAILQEKLVEVARFIKNMKALYEQLKDNPVAQKLSYFNDLANCIESPNLQPLFETLASRTFSEKASYFFRKGNVLFAYKLLDDPTIRKELEKGLAAVAEIDAFISIAKLYNEYTTKRVKFCFPSYRVNQTSPFIQLEGYWNPIIDPTKAVENSTELGATEQTRNAVITGPNSAGKSTILRSIALSIILAQSIGIAPARAMTLTPFAQVATYMNISDDIGDKTSLFQSEVDRAINLQRRIEALPEGQFSFSLFDELFSGTSPDEGMAYAYATAEAIGQLSNSIVMIATHFDLLTNLARKTPYFTNYKVSVEKGATLKRLYKLEPGVSQQHIALEVAQERGVTGNILQQAQKMLQEITKHPSKRSRQAERK